MVLAEDVAGGERTVNRRQGVLVEWNDDRGFGFIAPTLGGPRTFVHATSFPTGRRPVSGCRLSYLEGRDQHNRPRAVQVRYESRSPVVRAGARGTAAALATAALFVSLLACLVMLGEAPVALLASYAVFSAIGFLVYRADKVAAVQGRWRTSESTLHLIDLLGGWPGGLVARHAYRHKTTKQPFRTIFWSTVLVNCAALAWFVFADPLAML